MTALTKITDVSAMYDVTARTLRYYEDMGLITSSRNDDYAYRLYDENALQRLEQILILRKLNINIKDIQRIFNDAGSSIVLDVLSKKAQSIDDEVALLHELKDIVMDFISKIEGLNFADNADIKLLYDKAKDIEMHITNVDYIGKPSNASRLMKVTEKLDDTRLTTPVVIRAYRQHFGATRFIGKKFNSGKDAWDEKNKNDFTLSLKNQREISSNKLGEDADALIGLMSMRSGDIEYWLGYFTPENTPVPDGFDHEDFSETELGVGWIYGKEDEIYATERIVVPRLQEEGIEFLPDSKWWFERYSPIRNVVDKRGYAIIDICFIGVK